MKKLLQITSVTIAVLMLLATPCLAEENGTYSSIYFGSYDSSIRIVSGNTLEIWFDVVGNGTMYEIGVSSIELEYSSDAVNWFPAKTFLPESYPQMICENTFVAYDCVTYAGMYDFCYRAYVTFYAKNSRGQGYMTEYSETVYIPMP